MTRDRSSVRIDADPESLLTVETDFDPDFEEDVEEAQIVVEEWFETGAGRESELCTRRTVVLTGVGPGGIFGRGFFGAGVQSPLGSPIVFPMGLFLREMGVCSCEAFLLRSVDEVLLDSLTGCVTDTLFLDSVT